VTSRTSPGDAGNGPALSESNTWSCGGWVLFSFGLFVSVVLEFFLAVYLTLGYSSTCNEAPNPSDVAAGQQAVLLATLALAAPWALAVALVRPKTPIVVAAVVCLGPFLLFALSRLGPDSWVGSFCF